MALGGQELGGRGNDGRVGGPLPLPAPCEEGSEGLEIVVGNGVGFVVVAAGALQRETEDGSEMGRAGGGLGVEAIEGGGEFLLLGCIRQQISRELFDGELVKW